MSQHLEKANGVYGNVVTFEECVIPPFSRKVFECTATITVLVTCKAAIMKEYGDDPVAPIVITMEQGHHRVQVKMCNDSGESD